jgi:tetratricopeptide (TPR) repeat protein
MPGQIAFLKTNPPASALPAARVANPTAGSGAAASTPDEAGMALADAIDTLTSPQSSFAQKLAVRDKLRKEGRLNDIMGALKQLASQNPNDATIATALGEAELGQARYLLDNGATPASTEVAVLALQADQSFNAALSADPTNWEAEFEKAAAMSRWPAALNKGPEVIDRLSALVTQQEAATTQQPEYAMTYVLLGQQYQAAGQSDKATQVWQQGLSQFPLNSALQHALAPAGNP